MKIYGSTSHIEVPKVGDLQLKVNSMWDFGARAVCFSPEGTAYDLMVCTDVFDIKTHHTKWKQADITQEIKDSLIEKGYILSN